MAWRTLTLGPDQRLAYHDTKLAHALQVAPTSLIMPAAKVAGHPSGTAKDPEDTLWFSRISGARPVIETVSLERAADAYSRMMAGDARFWMVLTR